MKPCSRRKFLGVALLGPAAARAGNVAPMDALYARTLSAYRGELTSAEIEAHAAQDPGPALYLGPKTPAEWAIAKLFASLPDVAHAELRRTGWLKWRAPTLPESQRGWLAERLRQFERRGDGPYPLAGENAVFVGFMRVVLEGLDGPQYSWFVQHPGARRDNWQTLVRVVRILAQDYDNAHRTRLAEVARLPETAPVPRAAWLRVKDPPAAKPTPEPKPEPLMDERLFRTAVKAYRGDLGQEERALLAATDPLIGRRLRMKDPADVGPHRLLGRLKKEQLDSLLYGGRLPLRPEALTREQLRLLEPTVARLNAQSRDLGVTNGYDLVPYSRTAMGFAFVLVPEVPAPALSWWMRSPIAPTPTWVTLINEAAVKSPHYFRAHLDQLRFD